MDVIDENKKKPRRARGTPSFKYRNHFAVAVIVAGSAIFAAWSYTPFFRVANKKFLEFGEPTEEDIDKRYMFSFPVPRTGRQIKKALDEGKEFKTER